METQPPPPTPTPTVDSQAYARLLADQNLVLGIISGLVAAVVGAAIWAVVTVITKYQIGWMAVGIGFLVGFAVRAMGKGMTPIFGIAGALLSLVGCLLGNLFSACGFLAQSESISTASAIASALGNPAMALDLLKATFSPMDLLFYGIAAYEGFKFSFQRVAAQP